MSPQTASQMIKLIGYVSIGFALAIAGAAWPPTSGVFNVLFDMVDWPLDGGRHYCDCANPIAQRHFRRRFRQLVGPPDPDRCAGNRTRR